MYVHTPEWILQSCLAADSSGAATVFPIRCRSKPRTGSDEAIGNSPRRDFQHFQFARGASLAGAYTMAARKDPNWESSVFRCAMTITVSRWVATHFSQEPGITVSHDRKPLSGYIDRAKSAQKRFRLSGDLHVPLSIYPSFEFSPQNAVSFANLLVQWCVSVYRFS